MPRSRGSGGKRKSKVGFFSISHRLIIMIFVQSASISIYSVVKCLERQQRQQLSQLLMLSTHVSTSVT